MAGADGGDIEVTELAQLRALVHPARWTVLMALYDGEPMTATQAAELTGYSPSAMSYHLQQLARMGLVERVAASGDGRERPWRARGTGLRMSAQPDEVVGRVMMRYLLAAVTKVVAAPPPADPAERPWPAAYGHTRLRLSAERAKALRARVEEIVDEYDRSQDEGAPELDFFWITGVRVEPPTGDAVAAGAPSGPDRARSDEHAVADSTSPTRRRKLGGIGGGRS